MKFTPTAVTTALLLASNAHAFTSPKVARRLAVTSSSALLSSSLTAGQQHALEVFNNFDADGSGTITAIEMTDMLVALDIDANRDDADALFKYLDADEDGEIDFDDFLPWYSEAEQSAKAMASGFQSLLIGRRTIEEFDQTPVSDDVLARAVQCAIAAPNRSCSEPWRFIQIGPATIQKFAALNDKMETGKETLLDWTKIPGWCVVTTKLSDDPEVELEDFKSVACAVQNFMLSMWSEGIGSKWTSGPVQKTPEFAALCNVDTETERVAGCIWYGFATGGLVNADPRRRSKSATEVLSSLP